MPEAFDRRRVAVRELLDRRPNCLPVYFSVGAAPVGSRLPLLNLPEELQSQLADPWRLGAGH